MDIWSPSHGVFMSHQSTSSRRRWGEAGMARISLQACGHYVAGDTFKRKLGFCGNHAQGSLRYVHLLVYIGSDWMVTIRQLVNAWNPNPIRAEILRSESDGGGGVGGGVVNMTAQAWIWGVRYTIWGVNHFPLLICTLYIKAFVSWFAQKVKQKIFERFFGEIGLKCVVASYHCEM